MTCRTCKWWRIPKPESFYTSRFLEPIDFETYKPIPQEFEVRCCTAPMLLHHERPQFPNQAAACDASDYVAELITGPDFGCVHHALG